MRIGYGLQYIAVLTLEERHIAVACKVDRSAAAPFEEDAYRKVLVTIFASEAVHQQGSAAVIRQWHVVVRVDQAVAVDVTIFHIARGVGAESLSGAGLDVLLVLEQAERLQTSLYAIGIA